MRKNPSKRDYTLKGKNFLLEEQYFPKELTPFKKRGKSENDRVPTCQNCTHLYQSSVLLCWENTCRSLIPRNCILR